MEWEIKDLISRRNYSFSARIALTSEHLQKTALGLGDSISGL